MRWFRHLQYIPLAKKESLQDSPTISSSMRCRQPYIAKLMVHILEEYDDFEKQQEHMRDLTLGMNAFLTGGAPSLKGYEVSPSKILVFMESNEICYELTARVPGLPEMRIAALIDGDRTVRYITDIDAPRKGVHRFVFAYKFLVANYKLLFALQSALDHYIFERIGNAPI